jgi:hypothetical protein
LDGYAILQLKEGALIFAAGHPPQKFSEFYFILTDNFQTTNRELRTCICHCTDR